ncbi:MAG: thiamine pyrophosphate-requiring protein [Chloroflexi bacterium]|nr:thiamine pyrophosphate-requiring protein [Chloroflexota bacterium]
MDGNTAIANILKMENTEYLFCFPANALIEACAIAGIQPIMSRTERTTVNMADGYTRVTNGRRTGVVVTQSGPGIENAFGGIAHAYAESTPILVIPGGTARGRLGQSPDFDAMVAYNGVTKFASQINQTSRIPEMMRRAYTSLRTGRGGPVMVQVPGDVGAEEVDESVMDYRPVKGYKSLGDPSDVTDAVKALLAAKAPVIYAGQGILWAEASSELVELAELVNAPVMTSNTGKSAFPENHPLSLGTGAGTMTKMVRHFLDKADLVFGIGASFTTNLASVGIPQGKILVQCTVDTRDLNKEQQLHHAIIGDARLVLQQLIEEVREQAGPDGKKGNGSVEAEVKQVKDEWMEEWLPLLTSDETPINPYRVIWDLMHTVDRTNTVVTHDSGHPRDQTIPFYEAIVPRGYLGWGNSSQLGYGLGIAMGAKLGAPDKMVVNIMGDAAMGMAGMDIETAVRHKIPILTIVLNNHVLSGYARNYPVSTERFGFTNLYGDYANLAQNLGAHGERIEDPAEIIPAIHRATEVMSTGRPVLLEFMTKEENRLSRFPPR